MRPTSTRPPCGARVAMSSRSAGRSIRATSTQPLPTELRGRVDLLLVNAPYVPTEAIELMPPEARDYEARVALDGGGDGLDVHRRVAAAATEWLAPGGHLLIETSDQQAPVAAAIFAASGLDRRVASSDELDATVVIGTRPSTGHRRSSRGGRDQVNPMRQSIVGCRPAAPVRSAPIPAMTTRTIPATAPRPGTCPSTMSPMHQGDGRLEAHQRAEGSGRQPAQREQFEAERDDRQQQGQAEASQQQLPADGADDRRTDEHGGHHGGHRHRDRQRVEAGGLVAGPLSQQDVGGPAAARRPGRNHTPTGSVAAVPRLGQQQHAGCGDDRPDSGRRPSRGRWPRPAARGTPGRWPSRAGAGSPLP